ncbi:putative leucine-rich repeat receptor-like serine/threonine-protein kinase At2g24130 [Phragmites australis]|uniref:putative leucine-rich repeat receptor-like serine/threonine-protein kinase At2g24130 n=1 Tax=Phragmites australis TaxID=29695 RepID=UPI002D79F13D|nr:putative leucine-rich repeat receptor-like serine/threonine-protein kinase At2g24130 [Phragmites australis]
MHRLLALVTITVAVASSNYAYPVDSHEGDHAALLSFKSGVRGNLSDWGTLRMCNWTGVACDSRGHVVHLLLSNSSLTGVISPAIGNLSALQRLELDNNHLSGSLPPELGMLSQLLELDLENNFLEGPIPEKLGLLRNMTYLSLHGNNLTGDIPGVILYNCSSLTYLDLGSNSLTGEIPICTQCRLPNLTQLILFKNRLGGGIPPSISNFTSLEWVLLHNNFLSGVLPSQMFNRMPALYYLYLSHNNFSSDGGNTNLEPFLASLVNCTSLHELGVDSNEIGGKIPPIIGSLSVNLSELYLNDNRITGTIPRTIGNLSSLTDLCLLNNMLEGPIPSEISQPRWLRRLDLSNNRISGEMPKSIGVARSLYIINISHNGLQGAIPETLSNLTELGYLVLDHNQLSGAIPPRLICSMILDLSYNKLTGQIPTKIAGLSSFQIYLNLSNNLLEGPLPLQIGDMGMIQALDLSANKLSGAIPAQIKGCVELEYVNLSRNVLHGSLPSSICALPSLHVLDVSFNSLTGVFPQSLQAPSVLRYANFSYNNFSGEVSSEGAFANLTDDSFLGNPGLCGSIPGMARCNGRHVRLLYIVIVVVIAIAIVACLLAMVCVVDHDLMKTRLRLTAPISQLSRFPTGPVNATGEKESEHPRISYRELVDATDGFSEVNLIGKGGYGHVYRGVLYDGTVVAVKVLRQDHAGEVIAGSFERECRVLRSIRHRNLIRVITACSTPDFKAVVLPFMPNGSLESLIHGPPGSGKQATGRCLDLDLLLSIASNVAECMAYVHHHAPVKVVHCDLKPSNVLLDGDMTAIVSDFGISKLVKDARDPEMGDASTSTCNSITRLLQGSVGYIAPEYGLGGRPSTQGDVYSFGVMLLEMISGKRPTDVISEEGHGGLHEWVKNRFLLQHDVDSVVERSPLRDPDPPQSETMEIVVELLELGVACSQLAPSMRPSMDDVAHEIACIRDGTWRKYRVADLKDDDQPRSNKY